MDVLAGSADVTTYFSLRLAASGAEATGLTIADFDLQYVRSGAAPAAKVDAVALAATDTAHTDNRAIEIDATDQPGLYRVDWPDAAFASGVREVVLSVKVAACFVEHLRVNLTPVPVDVRTWLGTAPLALSSQQIQAVVPITQKVDVETIKTQAVTCAAAVTVRAHVGAAAAPGAANGVLIAGSNAATTLASLTVSGPTILQDMLTIAAFTVSGVSEFTGSVAASNAANNIVGVSLTVAERTAIANEVEVQIIDETDSEKVLEAITNKIASVNPSLAGLTLAAIATSVWGNAARILTAGTNIVLAKGVGVTGFNDLSAAQVNAEADTALADYDGPTSAEMVARTIVAADYATAGNLATVAGYLDTEITAIKAKTDNLPASPAAVGSAMTLAANAITTASIADDAITDAKIAVPTETAGVPSRILAMLRRVWEWSSQKRTRDRSTGTVLLRNAADSATLETQTQSTAGTVDTQTKGA